MKLKQTKKQNLKKCSWYQVKRRWSGVEVEISVGLEIFLKIKQAGVTWPLFTILKIYPELKNQKPHFTLNTTHKLDFQKVQPKLNKVRTKNNYCPSAI